MSRAVAYAILVTAIGVAIIHVVGWGVAARTILFEASPHVPRIQSIVVLGLGVITVRAAALRRRSTRQLVVVAVLVGALAAFLTLPLPPLRFEGSGYMADAADNINDRAKFERRFPIAVGPTTSFHSYLGDLVMTRLERSYAASGNSDNSTARAYATLSKLAGTLFLVELFIVAAVHRYSRRVCRYVAVAIASPLALLYFGYYELGYLAMSGAVVPLLAIRRGSDIRITGSTLSAGLFQGFHTALHGFGLLGLGGGVLSLVAARAPAAQRAVRTLAFASAGVAMYLGWVFIYVVGMGVSIVVENTVQGFGFRRLFEDVIIDKRIAYPLFSVAGLTEIGLISMIAGVPLLILAWIKSPRGALIASAAYALPGLLFLASWWPPGAPMNLDLLMAAFPGLFAACWLLASSHERAVAALVLMVALHTLFWTNLGSTLLHRVWITAPS
ncbi:MAG TPA: hypothetical protein VFU28_09960 [Vicinamibacterales bacterium]|nr:hypothetical protein [Vicinamibacterales bacterium]